MQAPPSPAHSTPPPPEHEALLRDPHFQALLTKYPTLYKNLRRIWHATQHVSALPADVQQELEEEERLRPRRNLPKKRKAEIWTQQKADGRAVGLLCEIYVRDEGVAEWLELVRRRGMEERGETAPEV